MKKNIKLVALAAALVLGAPLASCGNDQPTSSSSQPVEKTWSDEEVALMVEKVGEALPYIEIAGEWAWDESYETLSFLSSEVGKDSQTLEYSRSLAKAGYTLDSDGYGDTVGTKAVSNSVLNVNVYIADISDEEAETADYRFVIDAYCQVPSTEWSEEDKAEMAKFKEGYVLPFINLWGNYYCEYDSDDEVLYVDASYRKSFEKAYIDACAKDGYSVYQNEDGSYFARKIEGQSLINIDFYQYYNYFCIEASQEELLAEWPAAQIASFLASCTPEITETCVAPASGTKFSYDAETYASYNAVRIDVWDADENELTAYSAALETAGYEVVNPEEGSSFYTATSQAGEGRIQIEYAQSGSKLVVYVTGLEPIEPTWPTLRVKSFFAQQGLVFELPAIEGPTKFICLQGQSQVTSYDYKYWLEVDIKDPSETLEEDYGEQLTAAGFAVEKHSSGAYSVGRKDNVVVFFGFQGASFFVQMQVNLLQNVAFPEGLVANWAAYNGFEGTVICPVCPSNIAYCFVNTNDEFICAAADSGEVGVNSIEDTYTAALTAAGWTVDDTYYDQAGYIACDPTEAIWAIYYTYNGGFYLTLSPTSPFGE